MQKPKHSPPNLKNLLAQLPYLPRTLSLVWSAAPGWTSAWAALLLVQGLLPVATVYLTRAVVDSLVAAIRSPGSWQELLPTLLLVGAAALVLLLGSILGSLSQWVRTAQSETVSDSIKGLIHAQAVDLDLAYYETPAYYDQLYRASVDAVDRPVALLGNIGGLIQGGITLLAMAGVLMAYSAWLPLILLISTLPALFVVVRYTLRFQRWRMKNTINERRTRYFDWMLTLHQAAAEVRLFGLGDHFRQSFQALRKRLRSGRIRLLRDQTLAEIAAGALGLLITGLTMAWMVWRAVQGQATLGDLALFYQAFNQGQNLMNTMLSNVSEIYRNILFLENLFQFLALQPQVTEPLQPLPAPIAIEKEIRVEGVRFCYPGSGRTALHGFDLLLPAGQIAAIVGENGAGKSTLIKLLCRFYDPEAGVITFDGADLRDLSLAGLRRLVTVLFQEPVRYHETVADNIAFGDLASAPDRGRIETAAQAAGAHVAIRRLPKDYETLLGKWFGGSELSVGEWQRVALARAFLRQASLIILDEPTSAMDSWAEADWLSRFRELVAGRTALIVTHRFTTAMQADVIHVMSEGRIVESGNHAQLMTLGGSYAQSWRQQVRAGARGEAAAPARAGKLQWVKHRK